MIAYSGLPKQAIPESEMTEEWYKKNLMTIAMNHSSWVSYTIDNVNYYQQIANNLALYRGEQSGLDWKYMREIVSGLEKRAVYKAGKESRAIMNRWIGQMTDFIDAIPDSITVRSLNRDIYSKRDLVRDMLTLKMKQGELFEQLIGVGVQFRDFDYNTILDTQGKIDMFMQENFKETNEILAYHLALGFLHNIGWQTKYKRLAMYTIVTGMAHAKIVNTAFSPLPDLDVVMPFNALVDRRIDDDLLSRKQYGGQLKYMTREDIITEYNITDKEELDFINSVAAGQNVQQINTAFGFEVIRRQNNNTLIAIIDCEWESVKPNKQKVKVNSYGNYMLRELKDTKMVGSGFLPCTRRGTLIGGKLMKNYGECINQTINNVYRKPELNYLTVIPDMESGRTTSMATALENAQMEMDYANYMIQRSVARDYGKIIDIDKTNLENADSTVELLYKLANEGILERSSVDAFAQKDSPITAVLDLNLSPAVELYIGLRNKALMDMRNVTNTSDVTQGLQTSIVGKAVMENTVGANVIGNKTWMSPLQLFLEKITQKGADQARMNIGAYGEYEGIIQLPFGDAAMIKSTKDMCFEAIGLYIDFDNAVDKANEQAVEQYAMGWNNAGIVSPEALLKLRQAKTMTQKINILEKDSYERKQRENDMMQAQAAMQEAKDKRQDDRTAMAVDTQQRTTQLSVDGKLQEKQIGEENENRREAARLLLKDKEIEANRENNNKNNNE